MKKDKGVVDSIRKNIKRVSKKISGIRFSDRMEIMLGKSIYFLNKKYKGDNPIIDNNYLFMVDTLFELIMRSRPGVIWNYSPKEVNDIFNESIQALYDSQNQLVYSDFDTNDMMAIFSLWQFEEQEDIFIKLYRYNYFFNFANNSINMKELFGNHFGMEYGVFASFVVRTVLVSLTENLVWYHKFITDEYKRNPKMFELLAIKSDDYYYQSVEHCDDIAKIAFSIKLINSRPFIKHDGYLCAPMPHSIATACTKSLLYRLTDSDNNLRSLIGKEVFENYVLDLCRKTGSYDLVIPEYPYERKEHMLSPDVLCFKSNELLAIDCKLAVPSIEMRIMNHDEIMKIKDRIISYIVKLYKALFVNYTSKDGVPFIEPNNRYGIVVFLERFDFIHQDILEQAFKRLNLNKGEIDLLFKHIRFDSIYDIERHALCKGNLINEIKDMIKNGNEHNFGISHNTCGNEYIMEDFLEYKNNILKIKISDFEWTRYYNN